MKKTDDLYHECRKAEAGYRSEYSGKVSMLSVHHIHGKPTLALRYYDPNTIVVTRGEHATAHTAHTMIEFYRRACTIRGLTEEAIAIRSRAVGHMDIKMYNIAMQARYDALLAAGRIILKPKRRRKSSGKGNEQRGRQRVDASD